MSVVLALMLAVAVENVANPPQVRVSVVICQGDPLGNRAEGTVRHLAETVVSTYNGRPALFRANGAAAKSSAQLEVLPLVYRNGSVWVDVNSTWAADAPGLGIAGQPGFTESSRRHTRVTESGRTFKVRIAAAGPDSQVWAEVTATIEPKGK